MYANQEGWPKLLYGRAHVTGQSERTMKKTIIVLLGMLLFQVYKKDDKTSCTVSFLDISFSRLHTCICARYYIYKYSVSICALVDVAFWWSVVLFSYLDLHVYIVSNDAYFYISTCYKYSFSVQLNEQLRCEFYTSLTCITPLLVSPPVELCTAVATRA